MTADHFNIPLEAIDPEVARFLQKERDRQRESIELIASENVVSRAVLAALGAEINNKTVEGYPGNRYHGGAKYIDVIEQLAIDRARKLFSCCYANVQPHSGSQANQAVFLTLLEPGDKIVCMALAAGGHLSHGAPPNLSGKWFDVHAYGVRASNGLLDYEEMERLVGEIKPKLLITGGSAYPRTIDFARFRKAADSCGAALLVDMAHFAGLVAAGAHESPLPHADVVTCTTTKTLRGPRGGVILSNNETLGRRIDSAVFPGLQGSVHLQVVAAKAVCFREALQDSFKNYGAQVVANARAMGGQLAERGFKLWGGGTDTHLLLADVAGKGITGYQAEAALERVGLTCNKNATPLDPPKPAQWTGIRLGSSAGTTRGFGTQEFARIGAFIADTLDIAAEDTSTESLREKEIAEEVRTLCRQFSIY